MSSRSIGSLLLPVLLFACAGAPPPATHAEPEAPPPPPAPARVESVGPATINLASGGTIELPAGFKATQEANLITLLEPDGKVQVWLVELKGEDLAQAIQAAWAQLDPNMKEKASQVVEPPPRDGWDAVRVESWATNAAGQDAQAVARRKGAGVWVSILRGGHADLDKRAAQIRTFLGSLKVPGLVQIDLSGTDAKSIATPERIKALDDFIQGAMERTGTPGLQIAVVEHGKIVHARGFGVRELGKPAKVDADTLMMIGSVGKSLTTLMMATAVDDKKLAWDQKVIDSYPTFKLGDEQLTQSLKVEDLVCACAGLPRKDMALVFEYENKKPEDVLLELASMKPSTGLRETFQYQNHMVAAGGYVAAHALFPKLPIGKAYDQAMQQRVFGPLGMKRSTLDLDKAVKDKNHALPHGQDLDGKHRLVPLETERFATYVRPSGGTWSSANEMARYVMNELSKGAGNKKRVASEANLTKRWQQQVAIANDTYYGLGFVVSNSKGLRVINHGGGTMGFATQLVFLPEKDVGVVMIANGTGGHAVEGVTRAKLMELWFEIDEQSQNQLDVAMNAEKDGYDKLHKVMSEPDEAFMANFIGKFVHPELGSFEVKKGKEGWILDTGAYKTKLLRHDREDGKHVLIFADPPLAGLSLEPGTAEGEAFALDRGQDRYVFKR